MQASLEAAAAGAVAHSQPPAALLQRMAALEAAAAHLNGECQNLQRSVTELQRSAWPGHSTRQA